MGGGLSCRFGQPEEALSKKVSIDSPYVSAVFSHMIEDQNGLVDDDAVEIAECAAERMQTPDLSPILSASDFVRVVYGLEQNAIKTCRVKE